MGITGNRYSGQRKTRWWKVRVGEVAFSRRGELGNIISFVQVAYLIAFAFGNRQL